MEAALCWVNTAASAVPRGIVTQARDMVRAFRPEDEWFGQDTPSPEASVFTQVTGP